MNIPGSVFAAGLLLSTLLFSSAHGQSKAADDDCLSMEGRLNVWTTRCVYREDRSKAPQVLAMRVTRQDGFDRVVFDLKGELTGYSVKYQTPPLEWYGEQIITVQGKAFVEISLYPVSAPQEQKEAGVRIATKQRKFNRPLIKEIKLLGWFEAETAYIIGLERRTPFRVQLLSNPDRLVVDFKH
jgi:hypothetical protein